MPELPEVQSVVDSLSPHLPGCTILSVSQSRLDIASQGAFTRSPATGLPLAPLLTSRTITSLHRRAKRIVLTLDNHATLYFHLGMTGHLALNSSHPPDQQSHPSLPHTHLTVILSSTPSPLLTSNILHLTFSDPRRFGKVVYLPPGHPTDLGLGPEPLTLPPADFHTLLRSSKRPLKSALLDQSLIAGLGNIYVDESLHAARLHPRKRATTVTRAQSSLLLSHIQRILLASIAANGSTLRDYRNANNQPGNFQSSHQVYNRTGIPCPTCQTPIQKITLAQRSTHFCPQCQSYRKTKNQHSRRT